LREEEGVGFFWGKYFKEGFWVRVVCGWVQVGVFIAAEQS